MNKPTDTDLWGHTDEDYARADKAVAEEAERIMRERIKREVIQPVIDRWREAVRLGTPDYEAEVDRMGE